MSDPFANHTPSVFVVCSPFQALCAIAAIRQLKIVDYKFMIILSKDNSRMSQVTTLLERYKINFLLDTSINRLHFGYIIVRALIPRRNKYHRLFLGDFRNMWELFSGCGLVSNGADVVYLDDGLPTVGLLNNTIANNLKGKFLFLVQLISKTRSFIFRKNLLTIYSGITNSQYIIKPLILNKVVNINNLTKENNKDVYIVGTFVDVYCSSLGIPEEKYINKLEVIMGDICNLYPNDKIIYIQHGREYKNYAENLCQQYGCVFRRPEMMVELELLSIAYPPKAIFGFTSAALYTLKKLFPSTRVVNILFNLQNGNPNYEVYKVSSEYYSKNGIELRKEDI